MSRVETEAQRRPAAETPQRRARVRAELRRRGLDALLVTDLVNVRYLTGFTGSNAALLLDARDEDPGAADGGPGTVLATDGRYTEQAALQSPDLRVLIARDCAGAVVADRAAGSGPVRIGFEAAEMTVSRHAALTEALPGHVEPEGTTGTVEAVRAVKSEAEIDAIARACAIGDAALADLIDEGALVPGRTERQTARRLEWLMYEHGAHAVAFETIVAAGPGSAVPHHRPTDEPLLSGGFVKIDFGAVVDGYHSDMTRTFMLGEPDAFHRDTYELVLRAQLAGLQAVRPGATGAEVDAAARSVIEQAGAGALFTHGLGHGVGLRIHEAPSVSAAATGTLPAGAVVTVEPGVYHAGRGGVRIEDTLVVREGGPELLTRTGKELRVL